MEINDMQILMELINKYGLNDLKKQIELNDQLYEYICCSQYKTINKNYCFSYNEDNKKQMFTNGRTSVFYLNEKILDFDSFKLSKGNSDIKLSLVDSNEFSMIFDENAKSFDFYQSPTYLSEEDDLKFSTIYYETSKISLNEYKLLKLLLDNPKIYISRNTPAIYAESEKGHAYVMGRTNKIQYLL